MRPHVHLSMTMNDQRAVGDVVWSPYDYTVDSSREWQKSKGHTPFHF